jgi:hypothetical protein
MQREREERTLEETSADVDKNSRNSNLQKQIQVEAASLIKTPW